MTRVFCCLLICLAAGHSKAQPPTAPASAASAPPTAAVAPPKATGPERWEPTIRKLEDKLAQRAKKSTEVLFVGSSSIRMWDLSRWFPKLDAVNHGFGGSEISDSIFFFDRIVVPVQPKTIVLYAGDNDISRGKSAQTVHRDFLKFVSLVRQKLPPTTRTVFIAIKPSTKRWKLASEMAEANRLIRESCEKDPRLTFVDIWTPMLGPDGKPRPDLFLKDGLHLNDEGYTIWTQAVTKALQQ